MLAALIALTLAGTASARTFENNVEWAAVCHSNSAACTIERKSEVKVPYHASGVYNDEINQDGWGKLWIHGTVVNYLSSYLPLC